MASDRVGVLAVDSSILVLRIDLHNRRNTVRFRSHARWAISVRFSHLPFCPVPLVSMEQEHHRRSHSDCLARFIHPDRPVHRSRGRPPNELALQSAVPSLTPSHSNAHAIVPINLEVVHSQGDHHKCGSSICLGDRRLLNGVRFI